MKKILGLVASQRKLANGEILIKEASASCGEEYEIELIRLADLNLQPCRGCYTCLAPGKLCPVGDDLYFLADRLKEADAVILAAPCYALGPAALTKVLGDRIIALAQRLDDFWGKPCLVIATAGIKGWEGYTLSAMTTVMRFMGFRVKDSHMFIGALPGEGVLGEGYVDRTRQMGQALFGEARQASQGECPSCWSDIWKFPAPDKAVCPMCGQEASLVSGDAGVEWVFGKPGVQFTREHLIDHFQGWLRGKVQEFIARRRELAEVRNHYKGEDNWALPERD